MPGLFAGDRFRAFAHLMPPDHALNPGETDRALQDRGRRVTAHLRVTYPEAITVLTGGHVPGPGAWIESLRLRGRRVFQRYLEPRQANLAAAVLLGLREQIDPEENEAFQLTGTVHLLVIAGLHLGIIAGFASIVFRRLLPQRFAVPATAAFVVAYMLLVDAQPPIVRATVLIVAACTAVYLGRQRISFNVLALAGLIVLAANPSDLFNVGPQLSFLSVAGLMVLGPRWLGMAPERGPLDAVEPTFQWKWRKWLPSWFPVWFLPDPQPPAIKRLLAAQRPWTVRMLWVAARFLRRLTLVSGAIWLLTLPLVMARFHIFNPIAIVLNTVVWLPMAVALVSGLALLLCGMMLGTAGDCMRGCVQRLLGHRRVAGAAWRAAEIRTCLGARPGRVVADRVLCSVGHFCGVSAREAAAALAPALLGPLDGGRFRRPLVECGPSHGLRCTFLSVGHGEAVVLELPDGRTVLYDAGRMAAPTACCRSVSGYLWSRGLTHIDAVVLSHADTDHYNALPDLLERFSVGAVYVSPVMFD